MRVLLVSASIEDSSRSAVIQHNAHYPLGLAYLHSYLESEGHIVKTLALNDYNYNHCIFSVNVNLTIEQYDAIGFNILSFNRVMTFRLIEIVHKYIPEIKIYVGGVHVTAMYEQIVQKYPYVVAVIGEGELTFVELLNGKKDLCDIDGIAYHERKRIVVTKPRKLIADLDVLPFPKHEIFMNAKRSRACVTTSRGCPYHCSFCCLDQTSGGKVRYRNVDNVIAEIQHIISLSPNIRHIWIHDDSFTLSPARVIKLCNEIVRLGIHKRVKFTASARFKPLTHDMLAAMERAGFIHLLFGLESGSEYILNKCGKHITTDEVINAMHILKKYRMMITAFLIVGLPGECWSTVNETINLVKRMQKIEYVYYDTVGTLNIYPATKIYNDMLKAGKIIDAHWITDNDVPRSEPERNDIFAEYITSHISARKLFTLKGFYNQWGMIPHIIKFIIKSFTIIIFLVYDKAINIFNAKK